MNPAVAEWVAKAEGDFLTAGRELRARKSPNYDAARDGAQAAFAAARTARTFCRQKLGLK